MPQEQRGNLEPPGAEATEGKRLAWLVDTYLGMTRAAFARSIGSHPQEVSRWIRDPARRMSDSSLERVNEETGVSVAWLKYGTGYPYPELAPAEDRPDRPSTGLLAWMRERGVDPWVLLASVRSGPLLEAAYRLALMERWPREQLRKLDAWRDGASADQVDPLGPGSGELPHPSPGQQRGNGSG